MSVFAVERGRRHFPQVNNILSTSICRRNARRYIPHGYCDDCYQWTQKPFSISHRPTYTELVSFFTVSQLDLQTQV